MYFETDIQDELRSNFSEYGIPCPRFRADYPEGGKGIFGIGELTPWLADVSTSGVMGRVPLWYSPISMAMWRSIFGKVGYNSAKTTNF